MENSDEAPLPSELPKVAIIGAGVCGLLSARHLKDVADVKVFDAKEEIGGCWLYTDLTERNHPNPEKDAYYNLYGYFHSSLYYNLHTNLPKECMTFKDFYHDPKDTPYIMHSQKFHNYLKAYALHYDLMKYISLNRTVISVKVDENIKHRIKIKHVPTNVKEEVEENEEYFDYVLLCNGHFTVPNIPNFPGKDTFSGVQFHVHSFRKFEQSDFNGKENPNILIVGGWISANDILLNLLFDKETKEAVRPNKIFVTTKNTDSFNISEDYRESIENGVLTIKKGNIASIDQNIVKFGDNSEEEIDTIVYCTGYKYSFPFLDPDDHIIEFDNDTSNPESDSKNCGFFFGPLYKRMFCINEKNIIFIGLVEKLSLIHSTYERQVLLAKEFIEGKLILPSKEQMLEDYEREMEYHLETGQPKEKFYKFSRKGYSYWDYNDDMCKLTTLPVDDISYKLLKDAVDEKADLTSKGNHLQSKEIDYSKFLGDIDFKPTSDKF